MTRELLTAKEIKAQFPISPKVENFVDESRQTIEAILNGSDPRLLVITGPCSIHDEEATLEYARKLAKLQERVKETMFLVMRVYLEKPRTNVGWKGFNRDPDLNGSCNIIEGLKRARALLLEINRLEIPVATEFLDPFAVGYVEDLVSWGAIGARTSESQTHREMTSNLSMPIGFKNSVSGDLDSAVNGVIASAEPQVFMGCDDDGRLCSIESIGNPCPHVILRGGEKPNYGSISVDELVEKLIQKNLNPAVIIDCSHANSGKKFENQKIVWQEIINHVKFGKSVVGAMLESNLNEGSQPISDDLKYGVSVTDACISWRETERLILDGHSQLLLLLEQQAQAA